MIQTAVRPKAVPARRVGARKLSERVQHLAMAALAAGLTLLVIYLTPHSPVVSEETLRPATRMALELSARIGGQIMHWKMHFDDVADIKSIDSLSSSYLSELTQNRLVRTSGGSISFDEVLPQDPDLSLSTPVIAQGDPARIIMLNKVGEEDPQRLFGRLSIPVKSLLPGVTLPIGYSVAIEDAKGTRVSLPMIATEPQRCSALESDPACFVQEVGVAGIPGWKVIVSTEDLVGQSQVLWQPLVAAVLAFGLVFWLLRSRSRTPTTGPEATLRHDLRNLCLTLHLQALAMARGSAGVAGGEKHIRNSAQTLTEGTRSLLDMLDRCWGDKDVETADGATCQPAEVLDLVLALVKPLLDKADVEIEAVLAPDCPQMRLPKVVLIRVLTNLLINTARYAPGSRLNVAFRLEVLSGGQREVVIDVADDGPGLPWLIRLGLRLPLWLAALLPRSRRKGEGIGLLSVREKLEAEGTRLEILDGAGARFRLRVPAADGGVGSDEPHVRLDGMRILVVDDSIILRSWLATALGSQGALVQAAASGRQAIAIAGAQEFDVMVLDRRLGDMNGSTLASSLANLQRSAALVGYSGHLSGGADLDAWQSNLDAFVRKGADLQPLLTCLARFRPASA